MESATRYEPAQLAVNVVHGHTEGVGHVGQGEAPVGLQQLGVGLDLDLSHVELVVGEHVPVGLQLLLHLAKLLGKQSLMCK